MNNKFQNFFDARKAKEESEQETEISPPLAAAQIVEHAPAETPVAPKRIGRPPGGKKSDPAYQQVTAYVRRATYQKTQVKLWQSGVKKDFSDLVEELLAQWVEE
jgi:hypothetical protein